jgi:dephospho-CoA kinase
MSLLWMGGRTPEGSDLQPDWVYCTMLKVALTGNVASGKSVVARIWADSGVPVVRADEVARDVVAPGTAGLEAVAREFGTAVLLADGTLDREKLRGLVFNDPEARRRLEGILHPLIAARRDEWMKTQEDGKYPLAVAEIPLLFEARLQDDFDVVVLVVAPREERLRRMVADRGIEEAEALRIMAAQIPSREKTEQSDYILENGDTLEDLEIRSLALLDLLRSRARKAAVR